MNQYSIEQRINNLKTDFTKVIDLKNENIQIFDTLEIRIKKLKEMYSTFIKNNKHNLFIFGLDSFHFQSKIIDIEYDDGKRLFSAITNRMYCEYFKLYKIIVEYILENISDKKIIELTKINNNFPIYKDLEPFRQYDFGMIQNLHETIIELLNSIRGFLLNKELDLRGHQNKNNTGLNIDNFVNTFNYNNVILREKLLLFLTYIEFFHKLHTKYFKRFTTKMHLFISQINHDIKFEDTDTDKEDKKQSLLTEFANDEIDDDLVCDLKHIMNDSSDAESVIDEFINIELVIQEEVIQEEVIQEEVIQEELDIVEEVIQKEVIQKEVIQKEVIQEEVIQKEVIQEEVIQEVQKNESIQTVIVLKEQVIQEVQKKKRGRKPTLK
jgi:hypothetical protein